MYKKYFNFIVAFLLNVIMASGQVQPTIFQMEDYYESDSTRTNFIPRYGSDFTPTGIIKIPIIFAGFYTGGTTDMGSLGTVWPSDNGSLTHKTVPNYALDSTNLMQIIFQTEAQLYDPQYANIKNLTRFYYEMSNHKLT